MTEKRKPPILELYFGASLNQPFDDTNIEVGGRAFVINSNDLITVLQRLRRFPINVLDDDFGAELVIAEEWIIRFIRTHIYPGDQNTQVEIGFREFALIPDAEINSWRTFNRVWNYVNAKCA